MSLREILYLIFFLPIVFGSDQLLVYRSETENEPLFDKTDIANSETILKGFVSNETDQNTILSQNCSLAFARFSDAILIFTRCSIENARPIHICMKCFNVYQTLVDAYENLKKQEPECNVIFFSSDQLSIIDVIYKGATDLWSESNCQDCQDHLEETEMFLDAARNLIKCMENFNDTKFTQNSTCLKCHLIFANLSQSYDMFVNWDAEFESGICMDVVDTMNISRRLWTNNSCAVVFGTSIGYANILTALTIGATPVMFYALAKNMSRLDDVKLVRPKRKYTTITVPAQAVQDQ